VARRRRSTSRCVSGSAPGIPRCASLMPFPRRVPQYLRNVILQFLEHKEMRANLVRVLSVILHFTPQETRRLVAKAGS
jgi:hypothetical protein